MEKWEYECVRVRLAQISMPQVKPYWEWVEDQPDGSLLVGISAVFGKYGEQGWELVTMISGRWEGLKFQYADAKVDLYQAVFKRRVQ